jgi:hypothetical protein
MNDLGVGYKNFGFFRATPKIWHLAGVYSNL